MSFSRPAVSPTVLQILPNLEVGGVERGTLEVADALVRKNYRSIVVSGGGRLVGQLISEGSRHIELPVGKKSFFGLRLIPTLRKLFREQKIDIIHARSRFPAWLSYLAWKSLDPETRPVFITTVHGSYSVNPYSAIMMRGERIIAISEYIKKYILKNYPAVDEGKIDIIHRGISKAKYPYRYKPSAAWLKTLYEKYPHLKEAFLITLPGRITRWKGHHDFIRIISRAIDMNLRVHGLIAGGTDPGKQHFVRELEKCIANTGMEKYFTFLGHRDDMREILSISDIVLSLSQTPEAFGRTVLEALNLGIPVIAYDHGGVSEMLKKIFPAGAVEPLNIDDAVARIGEFYHSRPTVPDQNHFTLETMLQKTLSVYHPYLSL